MPLIIIEKVKKFSIVLVFGAIIFFSAVNSASGVVIGVGGGGIAGAGTCQDVIVLNETPKTTATSTGFEVTYPSIQGLVPQTTGKEALPTFIKYIFYLAISLAGFIAFGAIVYGGVKYLTAAGNPSAMANAQAQILAGLLGVILLLGSVVLLNVINPRLVEISLEQVPVKTIDQKIGATAGVYLLAGSNATEQVDAVDKNITIRKNFNTISSIPALSAYNFDNKTEDVCINSDFSKSLLFNAVLYTEDNYKGQCGVFYNQAYMSGLALGGVGATLKGDISSIKVFTSKAWGEKPGEDFSSDYSVKLYKNSQYFDDPNDPNDVCTVSAQELKSVTTIQQACAQWGQWKKEDVSSIRVGYGWVLATFQKDDGNGRCEIFGSEDVPELRTSYIGQCEPAIKTGVFEGFWKPCVSSIAVFKGYIK